MSVNEPADPYPLIRLDVHPPLATISMNRPRRHNALVPELLTALLGVLAEVRALSQGEVRAVILRAEGRSFSTGGDLGGFLAHMNTPAQLEAYSLELVGSLNQAILALYDLPVPVVAAVNGMVTGGSLGLVLAADVIIVSPAASFTPYYSVVGFSPDGGWTALLPAVIGLGRVRAILSPNLTITAEQAVGWGLASELVSEDELDAHCSQVAAALAEMEPGSLQQIKRLLTPADLAGGLEAERTQFVRTILKPETGAAMRRFMTAMQAG